MKRVKLFFVMCIILLSTVGVLAGKKKFSTGSIYYYSGVVYYQITAAITPLHLTTTQPPGCLQATITDCNGNAHFLFMWSGTAYLPLFMN
jgi:hypothetical protein